MSGGGISLAFVGSCSFISAATEGIDLVLASFFLLECLYEFMCNWLVGGRWIHLNTSLECLVDVSCNLPSEIGYALDFVQITQLYGFMMNACRSMEMLMLEDIH